MKNRLLLWGFALYFLVPAQYALAGGSLSVTPTKVYLDRNQKSTTVRLKNQSDKELSVQVAMFKWSQDKKGEDIYEPSKDVIYFPKILKIKPNSESIIRVGSQGKGAIAREKTYRMYVTEIPRVEPGFQGVSIIMRIGIPVFILPNIKTARIAPAIENVSVSKGKLTVVLKNNGAMHFIPKMIKVSGAGSDGGTVFSGKINGWYVHSGNSRPFYLDIPARECANIKTLNVLVEFQKSSLDKNIIFSSADCAE